ncbi:MAG: hypothetical protein HYV75_11210 [Opitutae bacterium]|nr:hypothetical protein [Opitutae bacterium]
MKKIYVFGGGLLLVVLVIYIGLTFFLGSMVKAGVNGFGPKLTQTKVELGSATLSPFTGSGTLRGLVVGNPKGWSDADAFRLGKVHVDMEPMSVFGDCIVIDEITIDAPEFLYETRIFSSNIKDLLKNIEQFTGSKDKTGGTEEGKPRKFVVKQFRLTNGVARLGVGPTAVPVPLPPVSLDDLGVEQGGITADQLAGEIMKNVLGSIAAGTANALAKDGGASALEKTKEAARKAGEEIKKLFGGKP